MNRESYIIVIMIILIFFGVYIYAFVTGATKEHFQATTSSITSTIITTTEENK